MHVMLYMWCVTLLKVYTNLERRRLAKVFMSASVHRGHNPHFGNCGLSLKGLRVNNKAHSFIRVVRVQVYYHSFTLKT